MRLKVFTPTLPLKLRAFLKMRLKLAFPTLPLRLCPVPTDLVKPFLQQTTLWEKSARGKEYQIIGLSYEVL